MEVVDLHLHSTASDGEATVEQVVRRAADAVVAAIALTDHDTVAGVAEATTTGAALGVFAGFRCASGRGPALVEAHGIGHQGTRNFSLRGPWSPAPMFWPPKSISSTTRALIFSLI